MFVPEVKPEDIALASETLGIEDEEEAKAILHGFKTALESGDTKDIVKFFAQALDLPTKRAVARILYTELVDVLYPPVRVPDGQPAEFLLSTRRTSLASYNLGQKYRFVPRQSQRTEKGKILVPLHVWTSSLDWDILDPQRGIARTIEQAQEQLAESFTITLRDLGFNLLNFFVTANASTFPAIYAGAGQPFTFDMFSDAVSRLRQRGIDLEFEGGLEPTDVIISSDVENQVRASLQAVLINNNSNLRSKQDVSQRLTDLHAVPGLDGFMGLRWWSVPRTLAGTEPTTNRRRAFVIDRNAYGFRAERGTIQFREDTTLVREGREGVVAIFPETNLVAVNPAAVVTLTAD